MTEHGHDPLPPAMEAFAQNDRPVRIRPLASFLSSNSRRASNQNSPNQGQIGLRSHTSTSNCPECVNVEAFSQRKNTVNLTTLSVIRHCFLIPAMCSIQRNCLTDQGTSPSASCRTPPKMIWLIGWPNQYTFTVIISAAVFAETSNTFRH